MSARPEIRFKKQYANKTGSRNKREHNNRRSLVEGEMTQAEVDKWFEEANKMPLVCFLLSCFAAF